MVVPEHQPGEEEGGICSLELGFLFLFHFFLFCLLALSSAHMREFFFNCLNYILSSLSQ